MRKSLLLVVVLTVAVGLLLLRGPSLVSAVRIGDAARVKQLLEEGRDPNLKSLWGDNPLDVALAKERPDLAVLLLDAGADPRTSTHGWDPFFVAAAMGPRCTARLMRSFVLHGRSVREPGILGTTVLHTALESGADECATALLDLGADPAAVTDSGRTTLQDASAAASSGLVRRLLMAGVPADARYLNQITPIMSAAQRPESDPEARAVIEVLLEFDADPCVRTNDGRTLSDLALEQGAVERARWLTSLCERDE